MIIRKADFSDLLRLVELAGQAFRDTYGGLDDPNDIEDYVATNLTPEYFLPHIGSPDSSLLLATTGSELIGYALLTRSTPPPCVHASAPVELARIYLRQEAVGRGHGAALMHRVQADARGFGADVIWLCVYDRNIRAIEFYRRRRFVQVGVKGFHFGGRVHDDPVFCAPVPGKD